MSQTTSLRNLFFCAVMALFTHVVYAQKTASDSIAEYRAMLQDGNPSELFEAKGEDLWTVSYTHLTLPTNREV